RAADLPAERRRLPALQRRRQRHRRRRPLDRGPTAGGRPARPHPSDGTVAEISYFALFVRMDQARSRKENEPGALKADLMGATGCHAHGSAWAWHPVARAGQTCPRRAVGITPGVNIVDLL